MLSNVSIEKIRNIMPIFTLQIKRFLYILNIKVIKPTQRHRKKTYSPFKKDSQNK